MKKILSLALLSGILLVGFTACAQNDPPSKMDKDTAMKMDTDAKMPEDKSKRPSPPAMAEGTTKSGTSIKIDYSQPSVKGREIGKDLEPMKGQVWRTGANEATVFEVSKDVMIDGKKLPAGKYGLFSIWNGEKWTIIFNKTSQQWGAFKYKESDDALRVDVPNTPMSQMAEKMMITVGNDGKVSLAWGNVGFSFIVM